MKKMRKGKKMLLILIIAIVVAIVALLVVKLVTKPKEPTTLPHEEPIVLLPETTYSDMQVKNISMQLLKGNASDGSDETMVSMEIHNTTQNKVEDDYLTAILIGPDENVLGEMPTWIQLLDVGEQYKISVVLKGDLTATTQIKLVEK